MEIIIDVDGTVCEELPTDKRCLAKPLPGAKESINKLFSEGHTIIFYTARSWTAFNMTEDWLKRHGFKYHRLIMGKPVGDIWIDDRALTFTNWKEIIKRIK